MFDFDPYLVFIGSSNYTGEYNDLVSYCCYSGLIKGSNVGTGDQTVNTPMFGGGTITTSVLRNFVLIFTDNSVNWYINPPSSWSGNIIQQESLNIENCIYVYVALGI